MSKRRVTLSIDHDLYFRVKARADTEDRTVRAVTERIISESLDGGRKQAPPTHCELLTMRRADNVRVYVNVGRRVCVLNTEEEDLSDEQSARDHIAIFDQWDIHGLILKLQELDREIRAGDYDDEIGAEAA